MKNWNNKKVVVVGLGKSGLVAARLLSHLGAQVSISEQGQSQTLKDQVKKLKEEIDIEVELGGHTASFFKGVECVVVSPGVPQTALPLEYARKNQIPVVSELELGIETMQVQTIAVTGSNGKSTTTTLIAELLQQGGYRVSACGNLGTPVCEMALKQPELDFLVVEVSSFQLETNNRWSPFISVLTNLTPNHLDRYESFEYYVQEKIKIFQNQSSHDWAIYRELDASLLKQLDAKLPLNQIPYCLDRSSYSLGAFIETGELKAIWDQELRVISSVNELGLKGKHNLENIIMAVNVALICEVPIDAIKKVLLSFKGLEHRLEEVDWIKDILFVNDSKATSLDAVQSALNQFESIVWMVGGRDKGIDFASLPSYLRKKIKAVIGFGESREKILKIFQEALPCFEFEKLSDATQQALKVASKGDVVLFSPGCSSYDQYQNFEQRGEHFKQLVNHLKREKSESLDNQIFEAVI